MWGVKKYQLLSLDLTCQVWSMGSKSQSFRGWRDGLGKASQLPTGDSRLRFRHRLNRFYVPFYWGMSMPYPPNMISLCPVVGPKPGARAFLQPSPAFCLDMFVLDLLHLLNSGTTLLFWDAFQFLGLPLEQKAQAIFFEIVMLKGVKERKKILEEIDVFVGCPSTPAGEGGRKRRTPHNLTRLFNFSLPFSLLIFPCGELREQTGFFSFPWPLLSASLNFLFKI